MSNSLGRGLRQPTVPWECDRSGDRRGARPNPILRSAREKKLWRNRRPNFLADCPLPINLQWLSWLSVASLVGGVDNGWKTFKPKKILFIVSCTWGVRKTWSSATPRKDNTKRDWIGGILIPKGAVRYTNRFEILSFGSSVWWSGGLEDNSI